MMEKMMGVGYPGQVGRFRPEQIAQQSTWTVIPEDQRIFASMHVKSIVPSNATTITYVNPVDPGSGGYYDKPSDWGAVHRAGIWR
jgi:hypothetical protein